MRTSSRAPWRSRRRRWLTSSALAVVSLPIFAAFVWADEPADRAAIDRTIAALNEVPPPARVFTADADASAALARLYSSSVTISHEPWREATITLPAIVKIERRFARFITPDVALVDGTFTHQDGGSSQSTPLLIVMRKEEGVWKIATVRILAPGK
jgi:hypothetical protein